MPGENLKLADEFAADYDKTITGDNWIGPADSVYAIKRISPTKIKNT